MEEFQNLVKKLLTLVGSLFLLMLVVFFGLIYFDSYTPTEEQILDWDAETMVLNNP